ncbi:MAG: helix-turn-helix transcriptional regulator [Bacteroidota bacterium]
MSWRRKTDKAILQTLGERVKLARMQANYTQAQLATKAGVSRRTLQLFEGGEGGNLTTFIQLIRALGRIDQLAELLQPMESISPLAMLEEQEKPKQRVRN